MYNYQQSYSEMSDSELLNVAAETAALVPEAQDALQAELRKRQLSQLDVTEYQQDRARDAETQSSRPPAFTIRGAGTLLYGKRDFGADSSYLTTRWFVVSRIPIVPLASLRVRRIRSWSPFENWSDSHQVLARCKPVLKQVLFVYAYVVCFAGTLYLLRFHWARELIAVCLLSLVPSVLRRYARANIALNHSDSNLEAPQPPAIT